MNPEPRHALVRRAAAAGTGPAPGPATLVLQLRPSDDPGAREEPSETLGALRVTRVRIDETPTRRMSIRGTDDGLRFVYLRLRHAGLLDGAPSRRLVHVASHGAFEFDNTVVDILVLDAPIQQFGAEGERLAEQPDSTRIDGLPASLCILLDLLLINAPALDPADARGVAAELSTLITAAIAYRSSAAAASAWRSDLYARSMDLIERRYRIRGWDVDRLCAELNIALRSLQRAFQEHGDSIAVTLADRRFSAVLLRLSRDPEPIAQVVTEAGYPGNPQVARRVREQFGRSLKEYRAESRGAGA